MTHVPESSTDLPARSPATGGGWFDRLHPRSGPQLQYRLVAVIWTIAAAILAYRAVGWLIGAPLAVPLWIAALVLGELKARYLMDKVALRAIERIRSRGPRSWVGGVLAPRSWLLVAVMVSAGHALRLTAIPRPWLGALYAIVATGLLLSSRLYWCAARDTTPTPAEADSSAR
jgi:hypothetical protein